MHPTATPSALLGCLLGCALGDSVGLPFENLSRASVARLQRGRQFQQSLAFGRGLVSDDTEHSILVALSCLAAGHDAESFRRELAKRLRWWLLALPPTLGGATARAGAKLLAGWPPGISGVWSAGNGAAMRAPVLGVLLGGCPRELAQFVQASTCITHKDPQAYDGALAAAVAAYCAAQGGPQLPDTAWSKFLVEYRQYFPHGHPLPAALAGVAQAIEQGLSLQQFAATLGCETGVSGYVWHTVPVALYAWLRNPSDLRAAVSDVVSCGGDTDSVAAIAGAIVGAGVGAENVPKDWQSSVLWGAPRPGLANRVGPRALCAKRAAASTRKKSTAGMGSQ